MLKVSMLLACSCSACFGQDNPAGVGYGVFRIYCAPCHGIHAQGGRGPDLSRGVFSSGDQDADLARTISIGIAGTEMSAFGDVLGENNIRRVIAYVRSVNRHENSAVSGDASRGEAVFWGKGQCGNCHMAAGRGRAVGPDLSRVGRQRSLSYLRESIVAPNADVTPGFNTVVVVTRDGRKIAGVQKSFDNFSARIVDLAGEAHFFLKEDVRSMERQFRSLMPGSYSKMFNSSELDD